MAELSRRFYLSKFKVLLSFMCLRGSPISTHWNYACYCNGKTSISHQARNNTRLRAGVGFPIVGGDFLLTTGRVMKSRRATYGEGHGGWQAVGERRWRKVDPGG